jgi:hypothetical protein
MPVADSAKKRFFPAQQSTGNCRPQWLIQASKVFVPNTSIDRAIPGAIVTGQLWVGVVGGRLGLAGADFCRKTWAFPG